MEIDVIDGIYANAGEKGLYLKKLGEGIPAAVIEPGWGCLSAEWTELQYRLAETTTVISYDRAGNAESAKTKKMRSSANVAADFYSLLANSGVPGPFLIIAQAAGAIYAEHFARLHPNDVAGIIFVDPMTTKYKDFEKLDTPVINKNISLPVRMKNISNYFKMEKEKFTEWVIPYIQELYPEMNENVRHQLIAYQSDQQFYKTIVEEYEGMNQSVEEIAQSGEFPQIPIKVISHDPETMVQLSKKLGMPEDEARKYEELWIEQCKELAGLSKTSEFIIAKGADQMIHLSAPDIIIDAALDIYNNFGSYIQYGG